MKKITMVMAVLLISAMSFAQGKLNHDKGFYFDGIDNATMYIGSNISEAMSSTFELCGICNIEGDVTTYYKDKKGNMFLVHVKSVNGERVLHAKPIGIGGQFTWWITESELIEIVKQLNEIGK